LLWPPCYRGGEKEQGRGKIIGVRKNVGAKKNYRGEEKSYRGEEKL
jgi:hypothetical protein